MRLFSFGGQSFRLNHEEEKELEEVEKLAYLEEALRLAKERGRKKAREDYAK